MANISFFFYFLFFFGLVWKMHFYIFTAIILFLCCVHPLLTASVRFYRHDGECWKRTKIVNNALSRWLKAMDIISIQKAFLWPRKIHKILWHSDNKRKNITVYPSLSLSLFFKLFLAPTEPSHTVSRQFGWLFFLFHFRMPSHILK